MNYSQHADILVRHLAILPFRAELHTLAPDSVDADLEVSILTQAAQFAEGVLEPAAAPLDREHPQVRDGRVKLSQLHKDTWRSFSEMGWMTMAEPEPAGQGLSLALLTACEELFNRASAPFCMLATSSRTAASVLLKSAPPAVAKAWAPRLLSGEWGATICISEPDAGSDVGRIRTSARNGDDGWRVSGEKCWISFGDHDLTERIGHMTLARSEESAGVSGLSLFLIPSTTDDGEDNGVRLRRIEEKLGLHCSPTCQIGFEDAGAILLGQEGRGLQTLFQMMLLMRLNCGPQGTGVAAASLAIALSYAQDRKQGGRPDQPPVPIIQHADVQRQLLDMAASVELTRGLNLVAATVLDLAQRTAGTPIGARWTYLAQFLLPLVKDGSAWTAFNTASAAIQVLGGAGYTCEWPVERYLRDARVFPVFEGTSGIQALDVLHRRVWRDGGAGLRAFLKIVGDDADGHPSLQFAIDRLGEAAEVLSGLADQPRSAEAGAIGFLELSKSVAHGWIAARIIRLAGDDAVAAKMKAAARFYLEELSVRAHFHAQMTALGDDRLAGLSAWTEN